ncbi:aminopeptidase [Oceanirhabdus seepicola]|uniref:Aminopeptidase n=1 Tax=Oceanirhabdus seepicola TaxID=2828781 RepID=A0A9J6P590_9CLOT|nr:aminopeptidase [Oceanirhabdus seepicola]MCM1991879.1 aminopeptidase [Oceanirhabdus seepicola]
MDLRAKRLADVIIEYSIELKKGETILIEGEEVVIPFMKEVYRRAIEIGAHPTINVSFRDADEYLFKNGSVEQIKHLFAYEKKMYEEVDVILNVKGTTNTRVFSNINPEKMKLQTEGHKEKIETFFRRMGTGEMRYCGTLYPVSANAQEAGMSLSDYEDFVYGAALINEEDVIRKWIKVREEQDRICEILNTKKKLRIIAEDTDISMSIEGRKWVNCHGKVNFPDGEVFTGPVEDSVEGHIKFSFPGIYGGREVEGIRLKFEKGKVIEATAEKGEELLKALIETDEGAKFVGEIAVGTNYGINKFTRNMSFDEKIGGTVHLALGQSLPECLGKNKSAIHWDMLCDMTDGEIYADDELIYKYKNFII